MTPYAVTSLPTPHLPPLCAQSSESVYVIQAQQRGNQEDLTYKCALPPDAHTHTPTPIPILQTAPLWSPLSVRLPYVKLPDLRAAGGRGQRL